MKLKALLIFLRYTTELFPHLVLEALKLLAPDFINLDALVGVDIFLVTYPFNEIIAHVVEYCFVMAALFLKRDILKD